MPLSLYGLAKLSLVWTMSGSVPAVQVGQQLLVVVGAVNRRDLDVDVGIFLVELVCELLVDLDVGFGCLAW